MSCARMASVMGFHAQAAAGLRRPKVVPERNPEAISMKTASEGSDALCPILLYLESLLRSVDHTLNPNQGGSLGPLVR